MSPMSGSHTYNYDEEEQLWLSASTDRYVTALYDQCSTVQWAHHICDDLLSCDLICFVLTSDAMHITRDHCLTRDVAHM